MKKEDFKLIIIKSKDGGYTAFPEGISGLVIEAETVGEIPKKLATAFENLMEYSLLNNYIIKEVKL